MSVDKSRRHEAVKLAKDLRRKVLDQDTRISTLLMGCKTVCRYLDILEENSWIDQELNGYDVSKFQNFGEQEKALPDYRKVMCVYYNGFNQPLLFPNSGTGERLSTFKIPNSISELETCTNLVITGFPMLDLVNRLNRDSPSRVVKAVVTSNFIHSMLTRVRNYIHEFLDRIILEIEYGTMPEKIFDSLNEEVNSKLVHLCPNAIKMLKTAYENASANNPESWSNVASSCRRIIKEVADAILPPQSQDIQINGQNYVVNDLAYINRIIVALKLKSNSKSAFKFNKSMIEYVDSFLRNIQSYASKGDHSIFNKTDASRCVIYTQLLLGDIVKYYIESEAVTKELARPYDKNGGIQKYRDRRSSAFEELLAEAQDEIVFVSTTHEFIVRYKRKLIQQLIEKNITVTVMMLDPDSPEIERKEALFELSDLTKIIRDQLKKLCEFKHSLKNKAEKLIIKTYDFDTNYSYILVDPKSQNGIIKIEELFGDDPEKRPSSLAYKKDNYKFFQKHWDEIKMLKKVKVHNCN